MLRFINRWTLRGRTSAQERQRRQQAALDVLPGLYDRVPVLTFINLFVAVVLAGIFFPVLAAPALLCWFGLMSMALGLRLFLWHRYRTASVSARRSDRWMRLLIFTTGLIGAGWGLAGVLFHGAGSIVHQLFLGFTIGGMVAGSATSLTSHLPVFVAFYVPALVLYGARLAFGPAPAHSGMALLVAGFGVGIGLLGKNIHRWLRATEARYRSVVEDQTDLICRFLPDGMLTFVNGAYARYFGRTPEELIGIDLLTLVPQAAREEARRAVASINPQHPSITYEHPALLPSGRICWHQWRAHGVFDSSGGLIEVQFVGRDITERKEAEEELRCARNGLEHRVEQRTMQLRAANESLLAEVAERRRIEAALRQSEDRLRVALRAARMGVWEQDLESGELHWSPEMEHLFGLAPGSFSGRYEEFLQLVHPDDRSHVAARLADAAGTASACDMEYRFIRPDGPVRWIASFGELFRHNEQPTRLAGVAIDITERKQVEEHAIRLAHHDALTGLPNRRLLEDRLEHALARARRKQECIAVMLLDLDNFKLVNDSLGHPVGDKLLCAVADRLGRILRSSDTLARFGGDEFAIVQTDLSEPEGAAVLARKLIDTCAEPFRIDQEDIHTSTSIGLSLFPSDGATAAVLIKNADVALYQAKAQGRNRTCTFRAWMNAEATARESLESSLRRSLKNKEFVLYYQPLLNTESGRIFGVEALVRWFRSRDHVLLPETFIPLAEATGLIRPLGDWILREACRQAAAWAKTGRPLCVTVNLSAVQVRHYDPIPTIEIAVSEMGLDPCLLELEITESVFLDPTLGGLESFFDRLVQLGVSLSIDDFGTGYSSLAYLKHIPAHTIKIDRSFIHDLASCGDDEAIVVAVLALGRSLQRRVVAEGVETRAQMAVLHRLGCTDMQGFLIGQPQPADELEQLLGSWPAIWTKLRQALGTLPVH